MLIHIVRNGKDHSTGVCKYNATHNSCKEIPPNSFISFFHLTKIWITFELRLSCKKGGGGFQRSMLGDISQCYSHPPFFWHRYGNLHKLPRPTAKPIDAKIYSALFPQLSRCSAPSTPILFAFRSTVSSSPPLLEIAVIIHEYTGINSE